MLEAYILVRRCNFSFSDILKLSRKDINKFISLYKEEMKAEEDAYKQHSSR
jgi:hypothetical protein